jgi:O-antigen/teichoic acid export membrane protein
LDETPQAGSPPLVPVDQARRPDAMTVTSRPAVHDGALSWVRQQARETYVQLLFAQLCVAASAAAANVLMARALAPSDRGLIALMLQVTYLASQFVLLGSERSFIAGYSGISPALAVRAYTSLVIGPIAAGLAIVAMVAAVVPSGLRPARTVMALVAAFAVVCVLVTAVRAIAIATGRYSGLVCCTVLNQFVLLATLTALYLTGVTRPSMWFLAYVFAGGIPTAVCWVVWSRATAAGTTLVATSVDGEQRRAVRREGLALFPAAIANMGMLRVDRLVLPALASTAALGLYATVATMTELLAWPLQAYVDSRLGGWRAAHRRGSLRSSPIVVFAAVYALIVAPVLGAVIYLLIVPLFGEPYAAARVLVLPLISAAGLYAVSRVSLGMLIARGCNLRASAATVCGFAASLAAYVLLIPSHGASGAAYGSLIGYGVCLVFAEAAVRVGTARPAKGPAPATGR